MKAYFLVSPYLSDIQKGIQVSHCTCEMAVNASYSYTPNDFYDWATQHKTMVALSYGFDRKIVDIVIDYLRINNKRFWSVFEERELNNLPTVGFILSNKDVRKIGQLRQERNFIISKELRMVESFAINITDNKDTMSKRDWIETLLSEENPPINDSDFLKIISTFHLA